MRLAVIGAGGVGGLLAGLAARAGIEVALLARGLMPLVAPGGVVVPLQNGLEARA